MRLLLKRKARGSFGSERKIHALGTLTERISRFCSFLKEDLEPRVAASLELARPGLEQEAAGYGVREHQITLKLWSCFLRRSGE